MTSETEMHFEFFQPWSTFVMKTTLPPPVLKKMIRIADEIVENRESDSFDLGAGQMEGQFFIESEILEREEVLEYFLEVCRLYVVQAFCQNEPFNKENILKEEWSLQLSAMWINSQKDNEYFPIHVHTTSTITSVLYLKIPEFLPSRKIYNNPSEDGSIIFMNNASQDQLWGAATLQVQPQVGDFFVFPASQMHQVYPFRTLDGKGERRSISFNVEFTNKSEQRTI